MNNNLLKTARLLKLSKVVFCQLAFFLLCTGISVADTGNLKYSGTNSATSVAPVIVVTGIVTDIKGEGLPGVSVKIKGASGGASTDVNGKYSVTVADENAVLVFSYIGFEQQEKTIGTLRTINITLLASATALDEVVVVGYGTQKKVNLTGSVATVSGEELNKRVITNPASMLQGKLPGLTVIDNSGEPGNEGTSLRIRGLGTFSGAGSDPLVVIDGIPGNFSTLNPNDIDNISVLKDAASASIYGTRAANGVILVTTKKGSFGKFNLDYNYNAGITTPTRTLDIITNSVEYMEMFNKASLRQGLAAQTRYTDAFINLYRNPTDPAKYGNYDWQDLILNTVVTHNHYLSANGGANGTRYNLGLGYIDQPGEMQGFEYKKYTIQLGLNSTINKKITLGANLNMNYSDRINPRQGATEQYLAAITQPPMFGPFTSDGTGRFTDTNRSDPTGNFHNKNPFAVTEYVRAIQRPYNMIANLFLKVNVLDNLVWETRGGINFSYSKTNDNRPVIPTYDYYSGAFSGNLDVGTPGLTITDNSSVNPIVYSQLAYTQKLGLHDFSLMGGGQFEYNKSDNLSAYRRDFLNPDVREIGGGINVATTNTNNGGATETSLQSLYGRLNYSFNNKYLLEGNLRYDGSSRFAPGNRWALFPSFSAGWRVTQESFIKNMGISWLSEFKLRGSWGRLGNQNIGTYPYQANLVSSGGYPIDNSATISTGYTYTTLVDRNIKWETTEQTNLGFDAAFLNSKINISADWYNKTTFDILRGGQISAYKGLNAPTINLGKMRNKGWEFSVSYNERIGDISFGGNIGFQTVNNEVLKWGTRTINSASIIEEGHEYNEFFMYDWIGIFQSQAEIDASPKQLNPAKPGDLKFRDINGDNLVNASDRTYMDGAFAKYNYSLNLNFGYKNFDVSTFFYGVEGQKNYVVGFGLEPFAQNAAPLVEWRNAWTPENMSTTMPALYVANGYPGVSGYPSDYFLKDASFLRIKNVQLAYNVPLKWSSKIGMSSLRLYVAGDNLALFSDYPHLDPERLGATGTGSQFVVYPQNRVIQFGAKVKF